VPIRRSFLVAAVAVAAIGVAAGVLVATVPFLLPHLGGSRVRPVARWHRARYPFVLRPPQHRPGAM